MSPAWTYYQAAQAGLSRREAAYLPIGAVQDQISVMLVAQGLAKESRAAQARDVFDF